MPQGAPATTMPLPLYYNYRNLLRRKLSTLLTFMVVAVVVLVLSVLLSFASGISASLAATGSPLNILVMKPGATAESTSVLVPEEVGRLIQTPGVARGADGAILLSRELCVQAAIPRKTGSSEDSGLPANVAIRGVDLVAFDIHREVRIVQGRKFTPGALEVVVGKGAAERYQGATLGDHLILGRMGNRPFEVVGIFEAAGGALESEVWAPRTVISDSYLRRFDSSVVLRLEDAGKREEAIAYVSGPAVQLEAKTEIEYYEDLSKKSRDIVLLATILVGIMAIGAVFAVANTMFAAVDGRRREIAMLRTIGFTKPAIIFSFVIESVLICVAACITGLGLSMLFSGARSDFLSDATWTVFAFELKVTPGILVAAFIVAVVVGVIGAITPAIRAARTRIIEALRKA